GYFLPTYEVIYMICKKNFKLAPKKNGVGDVWEFTQEMGNPHPAPFPLELIERIIDSTKAKIVLDPFMGSGTTAVAALNLKRDYIGIDISPEYCKMAESRIKAHIQKKDWDVSKWDQRKTSSKSKKRNEKKGTQLELI
ncbi:MAG: site-specific DNA-methyltransferase, partial [Bdellovibrionales bacterium]|nr:site-specific DNA-methyltransferase [Bdellovibrionales bacterium]